MPGTTLYVLRRHWLQLLYLAEALLVAIGALGIYRQAETAGWIALILTALLHVVSWIVGRTMRSKAWRLRLLLSSAAVLVVLFGGAAVLSRLYDIPWQDWKTPLHTIVQLLKKIFLK
jgi:biotin transporter BioY